MSGYPPDENIDNDSKLGAILRKQQAIQELFSKENEGKSFEIQSADGSPPLKCNPKIVSVEFPNDLWFNRFSYNITLTCDQMFPLDNEEEDDFISDASESWSIEPQEEREEIEEGGEHHYDLTYRITHSLSAQGKRIFDETGQLFSGKEPWQWGRDWARSRAGFNNSIIYSGLTKIPQHYIGYNYVKSEVIDELQGQYSFTENWVLTSGFALEQYDLSLSKGVNTGIKSVTIQGSINGLETYSGFENTRPTTKISSAIDKFNKVSGENLLYIRCQNFLNDFSPGLLNSIPTQETIGKNPHAGTINYTFEYDNRPSGLIPGVISEVINVNYIKQNQQFASVFVLGRKFGPVLQDLGTSEVQQKNLTIEFIKEPGIDPLNVAGSFKFPYELISDLVQQLDPIAADNAFYSYSGQPSESYDPYTGIGSYNLNWNYEV